jgi:protein-L-isoaspartate(D-aspartate) O-methyltransferase
LDLVYSDRLLIIAENPDSSSSMPSMVARFLRLLDVANANTVLEIGTGSGYNAALLCERLGAGGVTSIDVNDVLVEAARPALARLGYAPTLAVADGYNGYSLGAPYDRIIATCSVPRIPSAWIDQLAPDGVLVAPLSNHMLVGLRRRADGSLCGGANSCAFMRLRSPALPVVQESNLADDQGDTKRLGKWFDWYLSNIPASRTAVPNLYACLRTPDLQFSGQAWDESRPALTGRDDGSWARLRRLDDGGYEVTQGGPRRLWDIYEAALDEWMALERPTWTRFGMLITPDRHQLVWLDSPESGHSWELQGAGSTGAS